MSESDMKMRNIKKEIEKEKRVVEFICRSCNRIRRVRGKWLKYCECGGKFHLFNFINLR